MLRTSSSSSRHKLKPTAEKCEVVVCPPALAIPAAVAAAADTEIAIGGQNVFWEREGAFTGEVSPEMLRAAGATGCSSDTVSAGSISARRTRPF